MKANYIASSVIGSISSSHISHSSHSHSNSGSNSLKRYDDDNYNDNDISISSIRKSHSLNNINSNGNGINSISTSSSSKQSNSPIKSIKHPVRLLPPLPLPEFQIDSKSIKANTITGNKIKHINHNSLLSLQNYFIIEFR
jgi:hypothetical protein